MTLTDIFRESGYLWPGIDGAADLLQSKDKPVLHAAIRRYFSELRTHYGREVISLTFAIFGNGATFENLDEVQRNLAEMRARATETPNLLPLFSQGLAFNRVAANTGVFRTHALQRGLTPAGWRWLSRQARATVRRLAPCGLTPQAIAWVNLLAQAGEFLPPWLAEDGSVFRLADLTDQVVGLLRQPDLYARVVQDIVPFLRIALRGACDSKSDSGRHGFIMQYEVVAIDVVRRFRHLEPFVNPRSTWRSLCEKVEADRRERERLAAEHMEAWRATHKAEEAERESWKHKTWESVVPQSTIRGVEVVPLCNNDQLVEEGLIMDHCLKDGTYLPLLIQGSSRMFSLRGSLSSARATLQISVNDGRWLVSQLKTFGNATAPAIFRQVALDVCSQYNQATRR